MGLNCQVPETIPVGKTVVLEGSVRMASPVNDRWVIVKAPHTSSLPGGIMVSSCLLTLPVKRDRLPIVLKNELQHDVVIPSKIRVAEVNSIHSVLPRSQDSVLTPPVDQTRLLDDSKVEFNLDDSPMTPEWKERVTRKLNSSLCMP